MPQLGESVTEGTVGRWLKQPGDEVKRYEPLLEVITDKVDSEVPSPVSGTLLEIVVPEGETVRVGTLLARVGVAGETAESSAVSASAGASAAAASTGASIGDGKATSTATSAAVATESNGRNSYLSPVVARLLAEHQLDVSQINGTGQNGRVTKQDVQRFITQRQAQPAPQPVAQPAPPQQAAPQPAPSAPLELPEDAELVPLSPMRRAIADHMLKSIRTAPHVTTVMEVDLSALMADRARRKEELARQGIRLTLTPYFVQAVVTALQQVPVLNGSFSEQGIVLNHRIHVGMAVALDEGLIVPVIRDADEKNLLGLARTVNDLAERARTRRLKPDETQGGTFTLTNHGTTGSLFATPIINQPQAGILGVGAVVKRPVVITQNGVDAIAIKPMCYLSLTFDHRIADGAVGDAFLAAVVKRLEQGG